jgi:hypothetical protein
MNRYREILNLEVERQELRNQVTRLRLEIILRELNASRCPVPSATLREQNGQLNELFRLAGFS